jgi:hypothetical protein
MTDLADGLGMAQSASPPSSTDSSIEDWWSAK